MFSLGFMYWNRSDELIMKDPVIVLVIRTLTFPEDFRCDWLEAALSADASWDTVSTS